MVVLQKLNKKRKKENNRQYIIKIFRTMFMSTNQIDYTNVYLNNVQIQFLNMVKKH